MQYQGRARRVGDHIDTDVILPGRYLSVTDPAELGRLCLRGLAEGWASSVRSGDILVAGVNFGCGSSREHAPLAILGAGIKVVVGGSFARIFYRNAFNVGLPLLEIGDAVERISEGDTLSIDTDKGEVSNLTTGERIVCPPLPATIRDILNSGGLAGYVRKQTQTRN